MPEEGVVWTYGAESPAATTEGQAYRSTVTSGDPCWWCTAHDGKLSLSGQHFFHPFCSCTDVAESVTFTHLRRDTAGTLDWTLTEEAGVVAPFAKRTFELPDGGDSEVDNSQSPVPRTMHHTWRVTGTAYVDHYSHPELVGERDHTEYAKKEVTVYVGLL